MLTLYRCDKSTSKAAAVHHGRRQRTLESAPKIRQNKKHNTTHRNDIFLFLFCLTQVAGRDYDNDAECFNCTEGGELLL